MKKISSVILFVFLVSAFQSQAQNPLPSTGHRFAEYGDSGRKFTDETAGFSVIMKDSTDGGGVPIAEIRSFIGQSVPTSFGIYSDQKGSKAIFREDTLLIGGISKTSKFYMKSDSELEWEIIFESIPADSVFSFPFDCRNLEFYYQDTLSSYERDILGVSRPDSVECSYAVYHSFRANNEYTTGKAFHIYRPKIRDDKGKTVWCHLDIDTVGKFLSISVPREFLDGAAYPVVVDPTFGCTSIGASNVGVGSNWCYSTLYTSDHYTASSGDKIDTLYAYFTGGGSTREARIGIYDVTSGVPDNKIMESSRVKLAQNISPTWTKIAVNLFLTAGTAYCVAVGDFTPSETFLMFYDNVAGAGSEYNGTALPDPWVNNSTGAWHISMYAVYSNSGGSGNIYRRRIEQQTLLLRD